MVAGLQPLAALVAENENVGSPSRPRTPSHVFLPLSAKRHHFGSSIRLPSFPSLYTSKRLGRPWHARLSPGPLQSFMIDITRTLNLYISSCTLLLLRDLCNALNLEAGAERKCSHPNARPRWWISREELWAERSTSMSCACLAVVRASRYTSFMGAKSRDMFVR
jgi:hypothetical protein